MAISTGESPSLMWFRQDLRLADNPALNAAAEAGRVLAVYIVDTNTPNDAVLGGASKWWLHHALMDLQEKLNGNLLVLSGDPKDVLVQLCEQYQVGSVHWNRMYEPWVITRDTQIKSALKQKGFNTQSHNGSLLFEPMQILKKDQTPYKVFTPYFKNGCLTAPPPRYPIAPPDELNLVQTPQTSSELIEKQQLLPKIAWDTQIKSIWDVSEEAAGKALAEFIHNTVLDYDDARNIPSKKGTSLLSPYLHFGQISPNQAWYAVLDAYNGSMEKKGVYVYLSELGWREFSYYLMFHFGDIQHNNFNSKFDQFPWQIDGEKLTAWQQGKTGVPIIDAGMRELWQSGYMHNRVRMIVASYLVKNLLIDWRSGERWFWDCLLDADAASNAAGWQWVAGCGADAAPYFRIFNPILQGEKFDKQGSYVKKYCPELSQLPNKYIHKPWEAPSLILSAANIVLGKDYPQPIVCLKQTRTRALEAYASIK